MKYLPNALHTLAHDETQSSWCVKVEGDYTSEYARATCTK